MKLPLPCIICGTELKSAMPPLENEDEDEPVNMPYGGTAFSSPGHYGSTVFDPMNMSHGSVVELEITVCDSCLLEATRRGAVARSRTTRSRPRRESEPWEPGKRDHE